MLIGSLDARTILLRFASEEDCRRVLRNRATVGGSKVWFSRWSPDWRPWRDSPFVPVWIHLPNLPLHLFNFRMIDRICGSIGKLIALDAATERRTRPNVASARVEVDLRKPLLNRIWIEFGNGGEGFWQRVDYDHVPKYCSNCGRIGHSLNSCRGLRTEEVVEGDEGAVCGNVCMRTGEQNVPICDQNTHEAVGNDSVENDPGTEQVQDVEHLRANEMAGFGQNERLETRVVEQGLEETASKMVRVEEVNDGKALNNDALHNKSMLAGCGNAPMTEAETAVIKGPISTNQGSNHCVECDENGEAEKEEEGANDKQGDSCSNNDGSENESTQSVSYETWAKKLKEKAGEDSDLVNVIEEAKKEVDYFFQLAFKELGKEIYDECSDEIVKKANEFFILKLEREGKEIGSRLKKELGWIEKDTPATKMSESEGSSNASSKKKGRVIKTSNDWVGVAEEFMGQDKGFESKVKEALKAVNDYLWTVFDKEKNAYLEEKKIRAVRAASIFLDIVKGSPVWGAENELLGRILKANRELIGGRICFWAEKWDL